MKKQTTIINLFPTDYKQLISNHSNQYMKLERINERHIAVLLKFYPLFKDVRVIIRKKNHNNEKKKFLKRFFKIFLCDLAQLGSIKSGQAVIDNMIRCIKSFSILFLKMRITIKIGKEKK